MLNPDSFSDEQKRTILDKFNVIKAREIFNIKKELQQPDREQLDNAVLEPLGLLNKKEDIKKALLDIYEIRNCVSQI